MLKDFKLGPLPNVHYIPDYLTTREEQSLIDHISGSKARWTQVSGRRLLNYGGQVHEKKGVLLQAPMPRSGHNLISIRILDGL